MLKDGGTRTRSRSQNGSSMEWDKIRFLGEFRKTQKKIRHLKPGFVPASHGGAACRCAEVGPNLLTKRDESLDTAGHKSYRRMLNERFWLGGGLAGSSSSSARCLTASSGTKRSGTGFRGSRLRCASAR